MRALVYRRYGRPQAVLHVEEVPKPRPGPGQVLVRVHAASANAWDIDKLTGNLFGRLDGPFGPRHLVLGSDVAGVVEAVGGGVTAFAPGDAVFGDLTQSGWGGFAEFAVADEAKLATKPDGLSFAEAAAIPQAGTLALQALRDIRRVCAGDKVLVIGGGGGAGSYAIQMAKRAGAEVSGSDNAGKQDFMLGCGADHVIDYEVTDFARSSSRYNLIVDNVARGSMRRYERALLRGGALAVIGGTAGTLLQLLLFGRNRAQGMRMRLVMWRSEPEAFAEVAAMCVSGEVRPMIDRIFSLEKAPVGLSLLAAGEIKGKLVVAVGVDG